MSVIFLSRTDLCTPYRVAWIDKFVHALSSSYRAVSCGTEPRAAYTTLVSCIMLCPRTVASPEVGFDNPLIMLMIVVFPDPFGPSKPKISPLLTVIESPSTAVKSPKRFVNLFSSIAGLVFSVCFIEACALTWLSVEGMQNQLDLVAS